MTPHNFCQLSHLAGAIYWMPHPYHSIRPAHSWMLFYQFFLLASALSWMPRQTTLRHAVCRRSKMLSCPQRDDLDYGYIILHTTNAPIWFAQDSPGSYSAQPHHQQDYEFSMIFMTPVRIWYLTLLSWGRLVGVGIFPQTAQTRGSIAGQHTPFLVLSRPMAFQTLKMLSKDHIMDSMGAICTMPGFCNVTRVVPLHIFLSTAISSSHNAAWLNWETHALAKPYSHSSNPSSAQVVTSPWRIVSVIDFGCNSSDETKSDSAQ